MKKYIKLIGNGEALTIIMIFFIVAVILNLFFSAKTPKFRTQKKKYLLYLFCSGLLIVGFEILLYNLKNTTLTIRFISTQAFMLTMGILHWAVFHFLFKKFEERKGFKEILFTCITGLYALVFLVLVLAYYEHFDYIYYFLSTYALFITPSLISVLFNTAISIPARLYKRWFYPLNNKYPSPQITEMRNIIILNFIFQKKETDNDIINFKVKAPRAMEFGRLFYYFINDYNEKHPNNKIAYRNNKHEPHGWYFHSKPKWFGSSRYIDPDLIIDQNDLKDGTTIICQRI